MLRPAQRRLVFLTTAFALSLLSCGREVTGPEDGINFGRRIANIAIAPEMPTLMQVVEGAGDAVPFTKVRVLLRNEDGSIAKDTMVDFPSDADSVSLALQLPIPLTSPDSGLALSLTMAYVNAAGDTVFRGGPNSILARPVGSSGANVPVVIPVTYDGVGKDAARVAIAPKTGTGVAGTTRAFSGTAFDAQNAQIANTPFVFFTLDSTRAEVNGATGVATWLPVRGIARIVASLPNGDRRDTATFLISLPASKLVLGSGNAQTGAVNAPLTDSIVLRTLASDDVPVGGVIVNFAVATGGGSLITSVDTSDANGNVSTRWTLGAALGAQTITATAAGLTGSPFTISAVGVAGTASRLEITAQPNTATAGTALTPAIVVQARDAFGNLATGFTGDVSIAINGTQAPPLGGTAVRAAIGGIATFNDLSINVVGSYTLAVTSGALTPDTSASIGITPAAAAVLEFVAQPAGAVAGAAFVPPVTVRARDAFGNVDTAFTGTVALSLLNVGSAVLSGSTSQAAVNGLATFSSLSVNLVGSAYSLLANSGALTPDTSSVFGITPSTPTQIALISGGAQSAVLSTALAQPIVVEVRDAQGNLVPGATVDFSIVTGGGSVLPTNAATNASGLASTAWTLGNVLGAQELRASLAVAPTVFVAVPATATPGAPAQVVITQIPTAAVAGSAFAPVVTAEVRDASGNVATSFTGNVTLSLNSAPPTAALFGTTTVAAVNGIATFNGLSAQRSGAGYTLIASALGFNSLPSAAFAVAPSTPAQFGILDGNNQTGVAGGVFPSPLRVYVRDQFGNPVTGAVTSWNAQGVVTLTQASVLSDANGIAANTANMGATPGVQATGPTVTTPGVDTTVIFTHTVTAGAAAQVVITQAPSAGVAGVVLPALVAEVRDALGNLVPTYTGLVEAALSTNPSSTTLAGTLSVNAVAGVATFNDLVINGAAAGYRLRARLNVEGYESAESAAFTVAAAAPASIAFVSGQTQSGAAGTVMPDSIIVEVRDAFNNPVAGQAVSFAALAGASSVTQTAVLTNAAGRAAVRANFANTAGGPLPGVRATTSGVATVLETSVSIAAGAASQLAVTTTPFASVIAGAAFSINAQVRDALGNTAAAFTDSVSIAILSGPAGATLSGSTRLPAVAGTREFAALSLDRAGTYQLVVSATGLTSANTFSFDVTAAAAATVTITEGDAQTGAPNSTLANQLAVEVRDAFGNPVPGTAVTWSVPTGNASVSGATVPTDATGTSRIGVVIGAVVGPVTIRATVGALPAANFTAAITAGAPAAVVAVVQPVSGTAGTALAAFSYELRDSSNNVVTSHVGNARAVLLTTSETQPDAVIIGSDSVAAVNGVATFTGLTVATAGQYRMVVTFGPGLNSTPSANFTVSPAPASVFAFDGGDTQTAVVTTALPSPLRVRVSDAFGNGISGVTVNFSSVGGFATFTDPVPVTDGTGIAEGFATMGDSAMVVTLVAFVAGLTPDSVLFTATALPGAANGFFLISGDAQSTQAGVAAADSVIVRVHDAYGNNVPGVTVNFSTADDITFSNAVVVSDAAGLAATRVIGGASLGLRNFTAGAVGASPIALTVTVEPGDATTIDIISAAVASTTAGVTIDPVTVNLRDALGNLATTYTDSVVVSIQTGPVGASLGGTLRLAAPGGVASFTNLSLDLAGAHSLRVERAGLSSDTTPTFNITAAAPASVTLVSGNTQSGTVNSILPLPLVVEVRDAFNNVVPGAGVLWSVTTSAATLGSSSVLTDASGRASTTLQLSTVPGPAVVNASVLALTPIVFNASAVAGTASVPIQIVAPTSGTAGTALPSFSYAVEDDFGNIATGYTGIATVTLQAASAGQPVPVIVSGDTVNVVNGVAVWDALIVTSAGFYDIIADFGVTLGNYQSTTITIAPSTATNLSLISGNAQTDTVFSTSDSLIVRVTDQYGNGIDGASVSWNLVIGGGVLTLAQAEADVDGYARAIVTHGGTAGVVTVTASSGTLIGSPVSFTLTATPAPALDLNVVSSPADVVSGATGDVIEVEAIDAYGNRDTSYVGLVTLSASDSPLGSTLGGTLTATAVNGLATFNAFSMDLIGAYTLNVQDGTLTSTVVNINVLAGAPANLTIIDGNNQTGFATLLVGLPLVVSVTDAAGNPVVGETVSFTVLTGGGSVSTSSAVTTSDGQASTDWTLGSLLGAQTLEASSPGTTPLTFTATATELFGNSIWTGNSTTFWAEPSNWLNGVVPTATDSVYVPAGRPNQPALSGIATVSRFTLAPGATFTTNNFLLTVTGSVSVPSALAIPSSAEGGFALTSSRTDLVATGAFPRTYISGGRWTVNGTWSAGELQLQDGAALVVPTGAVASVESMTSFSGATLEMQDGGELDVAGTFWSRGGNSTGLLTGGTLRVGGTFLVDTTLAFVADPAHVTELNGGATQFVNLLGVADTTLSATCSNACFGILRANKGAGQGSVVFQSNAKARGGFDITADVLDATGMYLVGGGFSTLRGISTTIRKYADRGGFDQQTIFIVDTLAFWGTGVLASGPTIPGIVVGDYTIVNPYYANLRVEGSLDIDGSAARVAGSLLTVGNGNLRMTDATDSLVVDGELRLEGIASSGLLTAGVLDAYANVYIGNSPGIMADSAHVLLLSGSIPSGFSHVLTVADSIDNRIGTLRIGDNKIVSFAGDGAKIAGDVVLGAGASEFTVTGEEWIEIGGRLIDPLGNRFFATTILTGTNAIATPAFGADRLILRGSNALSGDFDVIGGLWIESGGNLAPNTWTVDITDSLITSGTGIVTMNAAEDTIRVQRPALFNGGANVLTGGRLILEGRFDVGGSALFRAEPGHITEFTQVNSQQVGFGNPGFLPLQSHLGTVFLNKQGGAPFSSTRVFVNGQLITANTAQVWAGNGSANTLTIRGSDISALSLPNQPLIIVDGADITNLTDLRFTGFTDAGTTQLRIERSGGTVALVSPAFDSTAAVPITYLFADDVAEDASVLTIAVTDPQPVGHNNRISTDGTAQITGWDTFAFLSWLGVDSNWEDPANWVQGAVPTLADSVVVTSTGIAPQITAPAFVRSLLWQRSQTLSLNAELQVRNSVGGAAEAGLIACGSAGSIRFVPTDSARMSAAVACPVRVSSGVLRSDEPFFVDSLIVDGSGEFHLRTGTANVSRLLRTAGNGTLRMDGGELRVDGNAIFGGASTAGSLTAGTLTVHRSFAQLATNSPASFAPSGSHLTVLGDSTAFAQDLPSALGFATTVSSSFNDLYLAGGWYEITGAARSRGRVDVRSRLQGARFAADSGLFAPTGNISLQHLSVAGAVDVGLDFSVDTVEFRGPVGGALTQDIPSFNGTTGISYEKVVVAGPNVVMNSINAVYTIDSLLHVASGGLLFGPDVQVVSASGTLSVTGAAALQWAGSPPLAVQFDSVRIATTTPIAPSAGPLEFRSFSQVGLANFQPSGSFTATKLGNGVIDFDDEAGGAYFRNLVFTPSAIATLTSSVIVNGALSRVNNTGTVRIQSNQLDLNSRVLTVNGGLGFPAGGEQSTWFRNVQLRLTGDYSSPTDLAFNNIRFERMDPNPTPAFLLSQHTGAAAVTWQNIVFDSPLQSGLFFQWDATGSGSISFQNASPALDCLIGTCTPGAVAPTGAAGAVLEWVGGVSSQWTNPANWSPAVVPTFNSSVTIPNASLTLNDPLLDASTNIGSLTVQSNGVLNIDVSDTLNVFGNMTVDGVVNAADLFSAIRLRTTAFAQRNISAAGGIGTRLVVDRGLGTDAGDAVLVGRVNLSAAAFQSGLFLNAGSLHLNSNTLDIQGSLRTFGTATFRMSNPLDTMFVDQNFEINGGSTLGLLTDGEIIVSGVYFRQESSNSSTSFAATGNHSVRLAGGDLGMDVWFDTPDSTLSRFANLAFDRTGTQYLYLDYSPVFATNLTRVDGYIETFADGDLIITGSVFNVDPGHLFSVYSGTFVDLLGVDPVTCDGLTFNVEITPANFRPTSCHASPSSFTVNTWTGSGGDGLWSNTANWSLARVPNETDSVVVNLGGSYTVSINVPARVGYLTFGETGTPTLQHVAGQTLTIDSVAYFGLGTTVNVDNASVITGGGDAVFLGQLNFDDGTLSGTGSTSVAPTGTATFGGTGGNIVLADHNLAISGNATLSTSTLIPSGSPTILVMDGGELSIPTALSMGVPSGTPDLFVAGTLRITAGALETVGILWPVTSTGLVSVESGTLILYNATVLDTTSVATGARLTLRGETDVIGELTVNTGATLLMESGGNAVNPGEHTVQPTGSIVGAGTLRAVNASLVAFDGGLDIDSLEVQSANVQFNSTTDTLFMNNGAYLGGGSIIGAGVWGVRETFRTVGGNLEGTGTIAVRPGATFTWQGTPNRGWTLDIAGTLRWDDTDNLSFEQDPVSLQYASMLIRSGGVFDIQHGFDARNLWANTNNVITNLGSILKSSGSVNTQIRAQVIHSGVMNALSGELSFQFACTVSGGTFGAGGGTITNCGP